MIRNIFVFLTFLCCCLNAYAFIDEGEWTSQGEVALQYRFFEDDSVETNEDIGLAVFSRVEAKFDGEYSKHVIRGFARVDEKDEDRDLIRLEDAYFSWRLGEEQSWKFLLGYKVFNWTATEAFHPADMVNSRNYDSDLENLEKIGELTVELEKEFEFGTWSLYLWPQFERPVFPGLRSRLGAGGTIEISKPKTYDGDEEVDRRVLQYGTRLSLALPFMDLSLHAMRKIDRYFPLFGTDQFVFTPVTDSTPNGYAPLVIEAVPFYFMKTQYGATAQIPLAGFNFKFEGAYRLFDTNKVILTSRGLRTPANHSDIALGVDYTVTFDSGQETLFLGEFGALLGVSEQTRAELATFQRDVLVGFKHFFNDVMGSELTFTAIVDIERDQERLFNLSFTRRLSDSWKFNTGLRIYDAPQKDTVATGLEFLDGDNHVFFNLSRFF